MNGASVSWLKIKKRSNAFLFLLLFVPALALTAHVSAAGEVITGGADVTQEVKVARAITDISITGTGNDTIPVKLRVTSGTLAMSTATGITFAGSPTGSTLYFSGTRSDVNAALATLTYTRNTIGTDTLEVSLVSSGEVFFPDNGHLYEYVSSTLTWGAAKTAAEGRTKYGATGYLTTITSQTENDFVAARLSNAGWMGGSDSSSEGVWRWVTGPENGTQFWQGNFSGSAFGGNYANWNNNEPNDSGSNEDCGQFLSGSSGKWNDLPCSGTTLPGYVVEYGVSGSLPTVQAKNVAITTSDTIAPTVPGTPSTTSPTTTQKPAWTWSASTDAGVGLGSPAYTVQWSQDNTFGSGVSSSTAASTSFTHATNLADGTWYFRVRANDSQGNASSYSTPANVVVDTTGPSVPANVATADGTPTNSTSVTFTWNAAIDTGAGLGNPAYTVQWCSSSNFTTGCSTGTGNTPSRTVAFTEGTWYFRVKSQDLLGNQSSYSTGSSVVVDTTGPISPGTPSTSSPTNTQTPTWTWTAANDNGSGLASPAYTVQWSQDNTFGTGVTAGTANSGPFTHSTALADGTWYFRVRANDGATNVSSWVTESVVIDSTPPVISDIAWQSIDDITELITWTTDGDASSRVVYGPTASYGSMTGEANTSPRVTTHSVALTDLVACSVYHIQVRSADALGNIASGSDKTIITSGCAGSSDVNRHAEETVSHATGGDLSLTSGDDTVSLDIPADFGPDDADFQIKELDRDSALTATGIPGTLRAIGKVYDIKAMKDAETAVTSFSKPISVTLSYDLADIAAIIERSLVIYRWNSNIGWQQLDDCVVDTNEHTVTCTTLGFSTFSVFGQAKPALPSLSSDSSYASAALPEVPAEEFVYHEPANETVATSGTDSRDVSRLPGDRDISTGGDNKVLAVIDTGTPLLIAGFVAGSGLLLFLFVARRRRKDEGEC